MCMEEYLQKFSAYIAEHPPDIRSDDAHTLLDALFRAYCESAGGDSENVQQGYDTPQQQLQRLPVQDVNTIIDTVNGLCRISVSTRSSAAHFSAFLNFALHCQITFRYLSLECHTEDQA